MPPARPDPLDPAACGAWIDAYLAALPEGQRAVLQRLRETIAAAVPEATETISYDMPAFRLHGRPLIWYLAGTTHCSLYPGAAAVDANRAELAPFSLAKGTVRFRADHPIPDDLVVRLVRARIADMGEPQGGG